MKVFAPKIFNKANNDNMVDRLPELQNEIEKMREQVQNIE